MRDLKSFIRREVRCVIVEDFETGKVFKITNKEQIDKALIRYTENELTRVYNPDKKQKEEIMSIFEVKEENGKVVSKISGADMLIKVVPILTDIPLDLDSEEDIEVINQIIEDPNEVFEMVAGELNEIICALNLAWIENLRAISKLPHDVIDALIEGTENEIKKVEENETETFEIRNDKGEVIAEMVDTNGL